MSHSRPGAPSVEILLATYDGARFLSELLQSLFAQTHRELRVLARDDRSSDETLEVLRRASVERPGRFALVQDADGRLGARDNFARLMEASTAPYVMFSDQDDVWTPRKVEVTLEAMRNAEARGGPDQPVLVHTDLWVVDEKLRELSGSFWRYQHLDPALGRRLERALVQNVVTGCTVMVNRPLLRRALPIPREAVMHDWWVALVAAALGEVVDVPEATVAYRQHGANDRGAAPWSARHVLQKAARLGDASELHASLRESRLQAAAFHGRFADLLDPAGREAVARFAELDRLSFWGRRRALVRHGLWKHGLVRNLGLLIRV